MRVLGCSQLSLESTVPMTPRAGSTVGFGLLLGLLKTRPPRLEAPITHRILTDATAFFAKSRGSREFQALLPTEAEESDGGTAGRRSSASRAWATWCSTCTGHLSRNRQVGIEFGKGRTLEDVLSGMEQVAEGLRTTHGAVALSKKHGNEIVLHMERLLQGETTPEEVMRELMTRPLKAE